MSITSYKITDSDISSKGVVAAPTVLSGSPEENKKVFDRLVREVLKGDFNALVDALAASTGAGEIGAAVEGLTGETVQAVLSALKIGLDSKAASADVDAALEGKSDSSVTDTHLKSVAFDADTGVFTFTKENGTAVEIDTALEKVAVNFAYDEDTQSLILTLADGSTQRVSLAAFLTTTEFEDSDTLEWSVTADGGKVKATIKTGSITDTMLNSALKAMLKGYVSAAATSATNAAASESASLSYRTDAQTAAAEAAESRDRAAASQTAAAGSAAGAKSDADRAEAASAHPPQISGDGYWELWDLTQSAYVKTTYQAQGPVGKDGDSYTVKGLYATLSALQAAHPTGSAGDAWFVGTADSNVVYQWDVDNAAWVNVGPLKGQSGTDGEDGVTPHIGNNGNWFIGNTDTGKPSRGAPGEDGAPGTPGKSAYASAQDGGYTGTEAQFNADLAQVSGKANTDDIPTALSELTDDATHRLVTDGQKITWNRKQSQITASGILKGEGSGNVSAAVKGTDYAAPSITLSVALSASGWDAESKTQAVNAAGVTTTSNCIITAAPDSYMAYAEAGVRCTAQASGSLTFTCETVPTEDVAANVLILG